MDGLIRTEELTLCKFSNSGRVIYILIFCEILPADTIKFPLRFLRSAPLNVYCFSFTALCLFEKEKAWGV